MNRAIIATIGLFLLAGCGSGGGEDPAAIQAVSPEPPQQTPRSPVPQPLPAQPDIITATNQGLLRGKANGQGQQLIFSRPNMHQLAFFGDVFLANGLVYYPREAPPILFDYPNQDIWSVQADGSQDHAVLNTTANEFVLDAQGAVAIYEQGTYTLAQGLERTDFGSLRNGAPLTTLPITERFTGYAFMRRESAQGARAFFNNEHQIFSVNAEGFGLFTYANTPQGVTLSPSDSFNNLLIYREYRLSNGTAALRSVPISGGGATSLSDGRAYVYYAGHVGARVVYQSCVTVDNQDGTYGAGPCNVESIDTNGSGRAVLASHAANETVQGLVGSQVIIRRNLAGNDQLLAVPVGGGDEQLLMTMTDSEFVQLVVRERLLIGRPSGSWLLDLNGVLTQISTVAGQSGFIVIANAVCMNRGTAAWCMPLDGSTPAIKIADVGKVIGAL